MRKATPSKNSQKGRPAFFIGLLLVACLTTSCISRFSDIHTIDLHMNMTKWDAFLFQGWEGLNRFLFPLFVLLVLIIQPPRSHPVSGKEKVYLFSGQRERNTYGRFIMIQALILLLFLVFNGVMLTGNFIVNFFEIENGFSNRGIQWRQLMTNNLKTYIALLACSALLHRTGIRFTVFLLIALAGFCLELPLHRQLFETNWVYPTNFPLALPEWNQLSTGLSPRAVYGWMVILSSLLLLALCFRDARKAGEKENVLLYRNS